MNGEQFSAAAWDALLAAAEVGKRGDLLAIHVKLVGDADEYQAHGIEQHARTPLHAQHKGTEQLRRLREQGAS